MTAKEKELNIFQKLMEEEIFTRNLMVLIILATLTIIEILLSFVLGDLIGKFALLVLLMIFGVAKVVAIVLYFMHVKYSEHRKKIILGVFVIPCLIALPVALFPIFG